MIPAVSISFTYSECPGVNAPRSFSGPDVWRRAAHWLAMLPKPDLGYYKTDFTVTYEDGETYEGRYDIGADAPTLGSHIRGFIKSLERHPADNESVVEEYRTFAATYEIGD